MPYTYAAFLATFLTGALAISCGVMDLTDGEVNQKWFWPIGVVGIATGLFGIRDRYRVGDPKTSHALGAAVVFWLTLITLSTLVYLTTGEVGRIDNALFESVAGYSTTSMSIFDSDMLENTDRSVLWWRAGSQWIGGGSALVLAVAIIPFWGGGRELADPTSRHGAFRALAPTPGIAVRHIIEVYGAVTVIAAGVFIVLRVQWFDALTHSLTTISTGGFSNHRLSTAAFDSAAVEWATIFFMVASGASIAVTWWIMRGRLDVMWRSMEMRVYLGVLAIATALFSWWGRSSPGSTFEVVRHGMFTAASTLSTTGHQVTDTSDWSNGTYGVTLFLIGVGSMAGSAGGGFRWLRVIEAIGYFRRELKQQIHPNAVITVKVGSRTVSERSLERMHAHQTLVILCGTAGMFGVALFGGDLITSISASLSALSTFGPGLGDLGPFAEARHALSAPARAVLMPLMLAGRMSIYPVFVAAAIVAPAIKRRV